MISIVIPVYKNEDCITHLLEALNQLARELGGDMEAVFVVDGSPDASHRMLVELLPQAQFRSQLALLSRNFGSFAAIRAGLGLARGQRFAVMAADLQEPPELVTKFNELLKDDECDITVGTRVSRDDPWVSRMMSTLFWSLYRRFVQREVPPGGVDVFGCNARVRDHIVSFRERNSSLIGLLFWVGFRRISVPYARRPRVAGSSAWSLTKRLRYLTDSVFSFTDLPVRILVRFGVVGIVASATLTLFVLAAWSSGAIEVPGYTATILTVIFFGALNALGLGVIGNYVWRAFENTKSRPNFIVADHLDFDQPQQSQGVEP